MKENHMIIVEASGGLGNQLQQYALYRKLLHVGKKAKLDISWFENGREYKTPRRLELSLFENLPYEICSREEKEALIGNSEITGKLRRKLFSKTVRWFHENAMYHSEIFEFENMYLSGYFACEKYYRDILPKLRQEIHFPESHNALNREMAAQMQQRESVSVHIRRGDYLNPENAGMFGGICTEAYYETAISKMKELVPEAHFYIFSDDTAYAKEKYVGKTYTVIDINHGADSFYDMWLMSRCRHNICANSTFSFWGARLNANEEKIMVRPTIHKNSQKFIKEEMEELWKGWKFVSPKGQWI